MCAFFVSTYQVHRKDQTDGHQAHIKKQIKADILSFVAYHTVGGFCRLSVEIKKKKQIGFGHWNLWNLELLIYFSSPRVSSVTSVKALLQLHTLSTQPGFVCLTKPEHIKCSLKVFHSVSSCFWEALYSEPTPRPEQNFSILNSTLKTDMAFTKILLLLFLPLLGTGKNELLK